MKPISPDEVVSKRIESIPPEVIDSFNELIVEKMSGDSVIITVKDAIARIINKLGCSRKEINDKNYLDIEPLFEEYGWKVKFYKPDYTENYDPYYTFIAKNKRI